MHIIRLYDKKDIFLHKKICNLTKTKIYINKKSEFLPIIFINKIYKRMVDV